MPTIVPRTITELPDELERYEGEYRGKPQEGRIRLLRILRSRSDLTFEQAAIEAGVQPRSAYRWWKIYQKQGVGGLLNLPLGRPSRRSISSNSAINEVRDDISAIGSALMTLINGMPIKLALVDGINGLRDCLMIFLPDVDRISIQVNTYCDLEKPQDYHPNLSISQRAGQTEHVDEGLIVRSLTGDETPAEELIAEMKSGGYPFELYHEPVLVDLWFDGIADLGAMILWRDIVKTPISDRTRALVSQIHPFLIYVFSNLVTRHHYANPGDRVFYSVLSEMAVSAKLTAPEQRVISYRLMGYSYKRIAGELDRTVGAVKKQLASVHRKTGTQGHSELFAKYFSPRLLPEK